MRRRPRKPRRLVAMLAVASVVAVLALALLLKSMGGTGNLESGIGSGLTTTGETHSSAGGQATTSSPAMAGLASWYTSSSPPHSSQWLVVDLRVAPSVVFANDSGIVPRFATLASLNATKIGTFCDSLGADGSCARASSYSETGWYFDPDARVLFVHYVGDMSVKVSLFYEAQGAVFSTTLVTVTSNSSTLVSKTVTISSTVTTG